MARPDLSQIFSFRLRCCMDGLELRARVLARTREEAEETLDDAFEALAVDGQLALFVDDEDAIDRAPASGIESIRFDVNAAAVNWELTEQKCVKDDYDTDDPTLLAYLNEITPGGFQGSYATYDPESCQHSPDEDCLFCDDCGQCSEELDFDDLCPDCGGKDESDVDVDVDVD